MNGDEILSTQPPPPSQVVGNRWTAIEVPEIGSWRPSRRVTVVVPYYEAPKELRLTLAGLAQQTYPSELMEIVVIDDGSHESPAISEGVGDLSVTVHVQEDLGFGLARARNLGASVASGEILVFLDCDMIPERQTIEAHARWHHTVADAVTVGFRWHADFSALSVEQINESVATDGIRGLLSGQQIFRPEWIERHMDRTRMMTEGADDYFRTMSGGNLSVRADLFAEIGGVDESFTQWGGEDNEFGFRAIQMGAVIIPDRLATCWHQGEGHEPSPDELESRRLQLPKLQNLIANVKYRDPKPGCSYTVPYVVLEVDRSTSTNEDAAATIESILASQFHDLKVIVEADDEGWLTRRFASDGRVDFMDAAHTIQHLKFSPLRIRVPGGTIFDKSTVGQIVEHVGAPGLGLLKLTLPSTRHGEPLVVATATRAANRAKRLAESSEEAEIWIGTLFGERWESGSSLGVSDVSVTQPDVPPGPTGRIQTASAARLSAQVRALKSRRSVRFSDSLGQLVRAKTPGELFASFRGVRQSLKKSV